MVEPVHSVLLFLSPFLPPRPVPNSVSVESTDEALPNRIATNSERERERGRTRSIVSVSMSRAFQSPHFPSPHLALDNFAFH